MTPNRIVPAVIGVVLGVAIGLYYSWVLNPVEYVDTAPSSLREGYQEEYMTLIAKAYEATGDLQRARARIALFDLSDPADSLGALAQERLADGGADDEARALARLAAEVGEGATAVPTRRARVASTATPTSSPTPRRVTRRPPSTRTPTPTPTPAEPFELADRDQVCDPDLLEPLLQVLVENAQGEPVAGVEVTVIWDQGQDHFFTGLKPELGQGYGDFTLDPDVTYTVQLARSDLPVPSVRSPTCELDSGESFPGSIRLEFVQPDR